jgi:hypothetical protein
VLLLLLLLLLPSKQRAACHVFVQLLPQVRLLFQAAV